MQYDGSQARFESVVGLAAQKPPRDWTDLDMHAATLALADLALKFRNAEVLAAVKDRQPSRLAIGLVVGTGENGMTSMRTFDIGSDEISPVRSIADDLLRVVDKLAQDPAFGACSDSSSQRRSNGTRYRGGGLMNGESVEVRHVLGLSGGRDSAALAVFMRQLIRKLILNISLPIRGRSPRSLRLPHKTGRFSGEINCEIESRTGDFDFWLKQFNHFLPSPQTRWCTRELKLRPFQLWIRSSLRAGVQVNSYVAIRADGRPSRGMIATLIQDSK